MDDGVNIKNGVCCGARVHTYHLVSSRRAYSPTRTTAACKEKKPTSSSLAILRLVAECVP